jgi:hypothetical protein
VRKLRGLLSRSIYPIPFMRYCQFTCTSNLGYYRREYVQCAGSRNKYFGFPSPVKQDYVDPVDHRRLDIYGIDSRAVNISASRKWPPAL